jgi:hypothetical protein
LYIPNDSLALVSLIKSSKTENMIRKEMGLPLRTHYGVMENNGGPSYPPLLDLKCNYLYDKYQH